MRTFKHLSLEEREVLYGGLKEGLSLREIAGRLPLEHPGKTIDDETIYRYIYSSDTWRTKRKRP